MPLTDIEIRNAKPREKPYKLSDGGGLHLLLAPDGARYWRFNYRFHGKHKTLALGVYPDTTLAGARQRHSEAKKLLAENPPRDPSHEKKLSKVKAAVAAANTFGAISDEYVTKLKREGKAAATISKNTWLLKDLAGPDLGKRPIAEIEAPELLSVLRKQESRGRYETAHRLRSACGRVFRYAIATGRAARDPSADLRGALTVHRVKRRAALLKPDEIGPLETLRPICGAP